MKLLFSFLPWALFLVIKDYLTLTYALIISIALIFIMPERKRLAKGFYVSWLVLLSMSLMLILQLTGLNISHLFRVTLMTGSFALMAWISLLMNKPFTIQYAKEEVSEDKWETPAFLKVNRVITLFQALAMSVNTAAAFLDHYSDIISIIIIASAVIFTKKYPEYYRKQFQKKQHTI